MAEDLSGTTIGDKYRLESLVMPSPHGDIYFAAHTLMNRPAALRVKHLGSPLDQITAKHFFDDTKSESPVDHQNILGITDFGYDQHGYVFAVCDAPVFESLKTAIQSNGQTMPEDVANIGKQVAAALSASPQPHGDLAAENILLAETLDGGVAVKVTGFGRKNAISRTGDVAEMQPTDLAYVSPEQCSGLDKADERSDIYSLGAIMYEMLTGVAPFTGAKATDVMLKHIEEAPSPMSSFRDDLPPGIEAIVLKAMAKEPDLRYQNGDEVIAALDSFLSGIPLEGVAAAVGTAAPVPEKGRDFWKTAAMFLIGTGLLAAAFIYATSVRQTDPTVSLQPDANSFPVQPINPATGIEEQALASMPTAMPDANGASAIPLAPDTMPGGDNYNPWATGAPPPGGPSGFVPPGGQVYTIDPSNGSQFMPNEGGVVLVPIPANTAVKPTPTPRNAASNTNTAPETAPKPQAEPKPSSTPARTPATASTPAPRAQPTARPSNPNNEDPE